jgi:hypothetical protein
MYRAVYKLLGWEYNGKREQEQIRQSTRHRHLVLQQLKNSPNLFRKPKGKTERPWLMGVLVEPKKN